MLDKLTKLIHDQTGNENIEVTKDSVLLSDLEMSSFDLINLVCVLEDEFDVEIPDRTIWSFKTVGDVIDFLETEA